MNSTYVFIFTQVASTTGFVVVSFITCVVLICRHARRDALIFLAATLGLMFCTEFLKNWFRVPRPAHALIEASGYALPSGHAAGSMYLAIVISYFARKLKAPLRYGVYVLSAGITLAIGLSRFQLGVHTPFQIGVGYALGIVFALVCIVGIRHIRTSDMLTV